MKHAQFNFSHIQPTAMLRRVVDFQLFDDPPRFSRRESFIKRSQLMGIQIVHNQDNFLGFWEMDINQVTHTVGKIDHGALVGHFQMPPGKQRRKKDKQVTGAIALILIVILSHLARLWWQRQARFFRLLLAAFVKANQWTGGVRRSMVDFQHIFHGTNKVSTFLFRNAPLLFQPRLKFIFFSVVRTVSRETVSTTSNSMSLSASICRLQRSWPSGAWLQASWAKRASAAPSNTFDRFFCGRVWLSAASSPSSTHFSRVRSTVRAWAPRALAISASFHAPPGWASSASSKMRARLSRRAFPLPLLTKAVSSARSSLVNL